MIRNFWDAAARDIFDGVDSKAARKIPQNLWATACRKLDMLNAAHKLKDSAIPPGNRLEALKGEPRGFSSIRVDGQYRIIFQFSDGQASRVKIADYH
jgi:proteic killer suppression protein